MSFSHYDLVSRVGQNDLWRNVKKLTPSNLCVSWLKRVTQLCEITELGLLVIKSVDQTKKMLTLEDLKVVFYWPGMLEIQGVFCFSCFSAEVVSGVIHNSKILFNKNSRQKKPIRELALLKKLLNELRSLVVWPADMHSIDDSWFVLNKLTFVQ